jgi:hypothetical protein
MARETRGSGLRKKGREVRGKNVTGGHRRLVPGEKMQMPFRRRDRRGAAMSNFIFTVMLLGTYLALALLVRAVRMLERREKPPALRTTTVLTKPGRALLPDAWTITVEQDPGHAPLREPAAQRAAPELLVQ